MGLLAQSSALSLGLFCHHTPLPPQKKTTAAQLSCAAEAAWPSGLKCQNVKNNKRDFPGGLMVKTLCFHCRGA